MTVSHERSYLNNHRLLVDVAVCLIDSRDTIAGSWR